MAALIAACNDDESPTASVETTEGTTSTVEPKGSTGDLASRFDDAARCARTAELTEGPFYFDVDRIRSDIRENREGATLRLGVRVRDATGSYSEPGQTFLRGAQVTNTDGIVEFTTVYPGWYPGRTVHIHAKVHLDRQTVLTTQLYFADAFSDRVFAQEPSASDTGRDAFNDSDSLYEKDLELTLSKERDAYLGLITLDVASA